MEELEILQRQFENAAKEFSGMSHKLTWRGGRKTNQLIPIELKTVSYKPPLSICLQRWPYDITQDNDWGSHFDYAHFLIKPRRAQWDSANALHKLDTLASKLFPYISKVEKSLHDDPLFAYWNDNSNYLNDMVFYGQVVGYDVKLLLTMHILTKSKKLCIIDGHTEVKEGEPYVRTIDNVFLDGALVCAKLRGLTKELLDRCDQGDEPKPKKPLTKKGGLIYEKLLTLPEHKAMMLREIQDWLYREHEINLDEGTFKQIRKELEQYGLDNRPRVGYFIQK